MTAWIRTSVSARQARRLLQPPWHPLRRGLRSSSRRAHLLDFGGGLEIDEFDLEHQIGVGRNGIATALRAIAEGRRHAEAPDAALGHQLQAFGKAGNHPFDRKGRRRILVEYTPVSRQIADIVDQNIVTLARMDSCCRLERERAQPRRGLGAALALAGTDHRHQGHGQDRGGERRRRHCRARRGAMSCRTNGSSLCRSDRKSARTQNKGSQRRQTRQRTDKNMGHGACHSSAAPRAREKRRKSPRRTPAPS
jgi:hypothetical protein